MRCFLTRVENDRKECIWTVAFISRLLKTSRPRHHQQPIVFHCYETRSLCVVCRLRNYISQTNLLRGNEQQLFVSYAKPHCAVSCDTVGRWIKCTLARAGVDTTVFKAHSTLFASASTAKQAGVQTDLILKSIGWTNGRTFAAFYHKPVETPQLSDFILQN